VPHNPPPPVSPVDALLRLLMGSWTTYRLWRLRQVGPLRFGALRRAIPAISSKILTRRRRRLEEHGIVYRHHVPSIPLGLLRPDAARRRAWRRVRRVRECLAPLAGAGTAGEHTSSRVICSPLATGCWVADGMLSRPSFTDPAGVRSATVAGDAWPHLPVAPEASWTSGASSTPGQGQPQRSRRR